MSCASHVLSVFSLKKYPPLPLRGGDHSLAPLLGEDLNLTLVLGDYYTMEAISPTRENPLIDLVSR